MMSGGWVKLWRERRGEGCGGGHRLGRRFFFRKHLWFSRSDAHTRHAYECTNICALAREHTVLEMQEKEWNRMLSLKYSCTTEYVLRNSFDRRYKVPTLTSHFESFFSFYSSFSFLHISLSLSLSFPFLPFSLFYSL